MLRAGVDFAGNVFHAAAVQIVVAFFAFFANWSVVAQVTCAFNETGAVVALAVAGAGILGWAYVFGYTFTLHVVVSLLAGVATVSGVAFVTVALVSGCQAVSVAVAGTGLGGLAPSDVDGVGLGVG